MEILERIEDIVKKNNLELIPNIIISNPNGLPESKQIIKGYSDILARAGVFRSYSTRIAYMMTDFYIEDKKSGAENSIYERIKNNHPTSNSFNGVVHVMTEFTKEDLYTDDVKQLLSYMKIHSDNTRFAYELRNSSEISEHFFKQANRVCQFVYLKCENYEEDQWIALLKKRVHALDPGVKMDEKVVFKAIREFIVSDSFKGAESIEKLANEYIISKRLNKSIDDITSLIRSKKESRSIGFRG